jgi:DNA primase
LEAGEAMLRRTNYAKYMNSKESKLYLKEVLYGLWQTKENSVLWESDIIRRLH